MQTYCTRPNCSEPSNQFPELDNRSKLQAIEQQYCQSCGMPQILGGRYIAQKALGKGGFSTAYLALDRYSTQLKKCVIKQFQPSQQLNQESLQIAKRLFNREAEVLEQLGNQHSQIPELYAFFPLILSEEQFFYIVQEYIDGTTLEQEVKKQGKLNELEICEILEELLQILDFVHNHNSIHRDIKPSNIMRDKQGKLYLLDFGAAKQVTGATTNNSSTQIYSLGFAPPEQIQGRQVFPSTDLYALAATCIRLLTGKPIKQLYNSYQDQWIWHHYVDISDSLANILEQMLLFTPKERFQSAQATLKALQKIPNFKPKDKTSNPQSVQLISRTSNLIKDNDTSISNIPKNQPLQTTEIQSVTTKYLNLITSKGNELRIYPLPEKEQFTKEGEWTITRDYQVFDQDDLEPIGELDKKSQQKIQAIFDQTNKNSITALGKIVIED